MRCGTEHTRHHPELMINLTIVYKRVGFRLPSWKQDGSVDLPFSCRSHKTSRHNTLLCTFHSPGRSSWTSAPSSRPSSRCCPTRTPTRRPTRMPPKCFATIDGDSAVQGDIPLNDPMKSHTNIARCGQTLSSFEPYKTEVC